MLCLAGFWTDIYEGCKLFYLSGIKHNRYPKAEVSNLARFIAVLKFRPLVWRNSHPSVVRTDPSTASLGRRKQPCACGAARVGAVAVWSAAVGEAARREDSAAHPRDGMAARAREGTGALTCLACGRVAPCARAPVVPCACGAVCGSSPTASRT
jgi:hypothetical protein